MRSTKRGQCCKRRNGKRVPLGILLTAFVAVLLVCVGARIAYVNASEHLYPVEHYAMGEEVDLEGTFLETSVDEGDNSGYSVTVESVEAMTPHEFLRKHTKKKKLKGYSDMDKRSVLCVKLKISNSGNKDKSQGVWLMSYQLVPSTKDAAWSIDSDLWNAQYPAAKDMVLGTVVNVDCDSSASVYVPFTLSQTPDYLETSDEFGHAEVKDTSYQLLVARAPTTKWIDVKLPE